MNEQQFIETYCHGCGTQRCEGPGTEWFEGCQKRWNLEGMDPASEIERLNTKIMELSVKLVKSKPMVRGEWLVTEYPTHIDVECSACKTSFYIHKRGQYRIDRSEFCPECGANMERE